ncbi:hypothetical protein ACHAPT_005390 [Fusarium lateritium]
MVSQKFLFAFAAFALLSGAEAGVCYPSGSTSSITAETASSTTASTSTVEASSSATETTFTSVSTTFSTTFSTTASSDSITLSTTTTSAEPEETTYLRNGDFESSYDVSPWYSALDVAVIQLSVISGVSREGGHSLRLKFDDSPNYFLVNPLNSKNLVAEQDYDVSAWVRFGKEFDNGEGCTQAFVWCVYNEWAFAENGGNGILLTSAASVDDFTQVKATCRWSQAQLDQGPLLMLRFTCSKTLAWADSITMEKAGQ